MAKVKPPEAGPSKNGRKKAAAAMNGDLKPKAISVYLSTKDQASLVEIARQNNVNRHMLLAYAVRYFLVGYRTGHIKLDPSIEAGKVVLNVHTDLPDTDA
jgi:hypothetical protein